MSSTTTSRRPRVQRLALAGVGSAVLLVGIATPAAAADVVISLEPAEVALVAAPVENFPDMDPMSDSMADLSTVEPTPVPVEYGDTLTVQLPDTLDATDAVVELAVDTEGDGDPIVTFSSDPAADEFPLTVTVLDADTVEVVLPDGSTDAVTAVLSLEPVATTLGDGFTFIDPVEYVLTLDDAALADVTLEPVLLAVSALPCADAAACTVTAGSTVTLDLAEESLLRELGITDLSGVQVVLQGVDADGAPVGEPVLLTAEVTGSTATVVVPADLPAGLYGLGIAQETPSGDVSIVGAELTVTAPPAAPVEEPVAEEPTEETTVNAGLRSNTGVEAVETGSTGTLAAVAGAGLLAAAGVGGVAVARSRRRPAAESGTCAD